MESRPAVSVSTISCMASCLVAAGWLWLVPGLIYLTDAGCPFEWGLVLVGTGTLIAATWLAITALRPQLLVTPHQRLSWLSVPAAGLLVIYLCLSGWGLTLRLALCEDQVLDFIETTRAEQVRETSPSWIGMFHVHRTNVYDNGVYLYTSKGFLNEYGIAHVPTGSSPAPRTRLFPLYSSWHWFVWKF